MPQDRPRRPFVAAAAVAALLALAAGCRPAAEPKHEGTAPAAPLSQRVKALNGDVLVVDGASLRLANAFAPQPIPYARCWAEALAAKQATRTLSALIAESHDLDVRTTGERDEFDRPLALISVDQLDLGETLVAAGLAARRTPKAFRWCDGFSIAQEGAPKVNSPYDLEK